MKLYTIKQMIESFRQEKLHLTAFTMKEDGSYKSITYGELQDEIKALGNALLKIGIKKGDKIALLSENRLRWPVVYLAVMSIGAIIVPMDIFWQHRELLTFTQTCDIRMIFISNRYIEKILKLKPGLKNLPRVVCFDETKEIYKEMNKMSNNNKNNQRVNKKNFNENIKKIEQSEVENGHFFKDYQLIYFDSLLRIGGQLVGTGTGQYQYIKINPEDVALLFFLTGGTGVMLSHQALMSNANGIKETLSLSGKPGEAWLTVIPFSHTYPAQMGIFLPLLTTAAGMSISSSKIDHIFATMQETSANYVTLVPLLLEKLYIRIKNSAKQGKLSLQELGLSGLKCVFVAGARCPGELIQGMKDLGIYVFDVYGLTEMAPVLTMNTFEYFKPGSVGIPLKNVRLKIHNPDARGNGEVLAKGPGIMTAYYKQEKRIHEKRDDGLVRVDSRGWLHTGDIGRLDDQGFLYITGRLRPIIVTKGGINIYPMELEEMLLQSDMIAEVEILLKIDKETGEYPYARIRPNIKLIRQLGKKSRGAFGEKEIKNLIRDELKEISSKIAAYKIPRDFEITYEKITKPSIRQKKLMFRDAPVDAAAGAVGKPVKNTAGLNAAPIENYITGVVSKILSIAPANIDKEANFLDILDSTDLIQMLNMVEKEIQIRLYPPILFEYKTVKEFSGYLAAEFSRQFLDYLGEDIKQGTLIEEIRPDTVRETGTGAGPGQREIKKANLTADLTGDNGKPGELENEPVAIIGAGGIFPGAGNLDEFWENLEQERCSVSDIPRERFEWERYYGGPGKEPGKIVTRSGAFMDDIDKFDPSFFNISPREAELMDPQQRKFLEVVWQTIEDAGWKPSALSGTKTGLFVGVVSSDYNELMVENGIDPEAHTFTGTMYFMLTNRISYILNLSGPSEAIDTACSSSLTAIHRAVQAIRNNDCEMAIAGGVNALLTPKLFITYSKAGMLSPDGRCKTFNKGANGYVRGEGAAAVFLKPLRRALADGDRIYALIKGTAVNHGGRANSVTAPNPRAQARLLIEAYENARVRPDRVTYIEAHGTGTELGDPVEVSGLEDAFRELYKRSGRTLPHHPHCGLGAVKTNIGHLESAAGIAGVIKVLLAMKNKKLPGTVGFKELNPYIDLKESPFYIVEKTRQWQCCKDERGKELPRVAGVSSFGAGGANAHVVLEEYPSPPSHDRERGIAGAGAPLVLVPLSARNNPRLKEYIQRLSAFLKKAGDIDLTEMAYTLQVGRESMEERVVFLVKDIPGLIEKLDGYAREKEKIDNCYKGKVKRENEAIHLFTSDDDININEIIDKWIARGKLGKLAELWVKGFNLEWSQLYGGSKPRRISLPTYPFARERCWIPGSDNRAGTPLARPANGGPAVYLHPLLQENTSDLCEQRFTSTFSGREFFLADHVLKGRRVLPAAAYIEMARAAVDLAAGALKEGAAGIRLKNLVWERPITVENQPARVHLELFPVDNGEIDFEIYTQSDDGDAEPLVHSQGSAVLDRGAGRAGSEDITTLDLPALQARCIGGGLSTDQCYRALGAIGMDYGPGHRGIEKVYPGPGQVLAKLSLPAAVSETRNRFVLHPGLLDSAFQASLWLKPDPGESMPDQGAVPGRLAMPFALQELEITGNCTPGMWALVRSTNGSAPGDKVRKLDIDISDETGKICVRVKGLSMRMLEGGPGWDGPGAAAPAGTNGTLVLRPGWKAQAVIPPAAAPAYDRHLVILCEPGDGEEGLSRKARERKGGKRILFIGRTGESIEKRFRVHAARVLEEIQNILEEKPKGRVLIQVVVPDREEQQLFSGLSGLLKTAVLENPKLIGQLIEVEPGENFPGILEKLEENSRCPDDTRIRYQEGKRWVAHWQEVDSSQKEVVHPWKDRGVYLIAGGAGGLGLIFAREIARQVKDATLVLTGRSRPGEDRLARFKELETYGARIEYRQVDVTQKQEVVNLIRDIGDNIGGPHGIIHCAGVIRDDFILKKTREDLEDVLAPKVSGLVHLDQASKDLPLDFFIIFSSVAGGLGNPGQADYAAANAFMDAYARYRSRLADANLRQGRTLSIDWPLWKEGGMQVDKETEKMLMHRLGMAPMQTVTGIRALYRGLASGEHQVLVMEGQLSRMKEKLLPTSTNAAAAPTGKTPLPVPAAPVVDTGGLLDKMQAALMTIVTKLLKVNTEDMDADTEMKEYGFDSITFTDFANELNREYKLELTPAIFFEHPTLHRLAQYLVEEHQTVFAARFAVQASTGSVVKAIEDKVADIPANKTRRSRFAKTVERRASKTGTTAHEPIAVVGMSGKFPMAGDVNEFWRNLVEEKDCITEIPTDRWDWREYWGDPTKEANKTNIKWGAFIDGVDEFDPLFFGISPKEAELMDPQQRLLMTYVWKAIEDAGYSAQSLSGTKTAIFVGTIDSGYGKLISRANIAVEGYSSTGTVPSVGPNRMSYFLNIHGPSEPVETACSSSLIAIHRAVEAIATGTCEMAVVGGVNTLLTPELHISFNKAGMLCEDGRCKTFSNKANGYVRGEGVGMLFLKKLTEAEQAGDHIYGVIRATAENHGGRANSLTAPNPGAQADLLKSAYTRAGIDPGTVGYIETHGTGTHLGDPIEINGLKTAFKELYRAAGNPRAAGVHCGLGSVKSNIGHLELAAGVAGVIKVLLQFKHKTLVKSLHCDTINPYIQLEDSPFYIVRETREWLPCQDARGSRLPRRAGVSSFGFGGANAHVVIEEYISKEPREQERSQIAITPRNPAIIVLSAKDEERLREQARQLLAAAASSGWERQRPGSSLADIAYTLQVGREPMEERLAMMAASVKELRDKLDGFLKGRDDIENLYRGQVKRNKEMLAVFAADEELQEAIDKWVQREKYAKLMDLWVKGLIFDWNKLYGDGKPRRISLPTYPFAKERCWIPDSRGRESVPGRNKGMDGYPSGMEIEHENRPVNRTACCLEKQWESSSAAPTGEFSRTIAVLTTDETKELATRVSRHFPGSRILHPHDLESQIQEPEQGWKNYDGCIDLTGCGTDNNRSTAWIVWLQQLIERGRREGLMMLCVTKGLESYQNPAVNLSGALRAGLYRMLQSEYSHLRSRHMDADTFPDDKALARQIASEFLMDSEDAEICYRQGKRFRAYLREYQPGGISDRTFVFPGEHVLWITGGTRGLGYLCARHFVTHYGVKRLVLTGREVMPPREQWDSNQRQNTSTAQKIKHIRALEARGAQVRVLSVDLTDKPAVQQALQEIKRTMGPIGGIIHSAGISDPDNPAFIRKSIDKIQQVLAPKTTGLDIMAQCFNNEPLRFFILFSSVSAIIPTLGAGQSDYVMANAYMDYAAEARLHDCPIVSIQWPSWKETGMGEIKSRAYQQTGLLGHTDEEGLKLLDHILSGKMGPVVLPAVVNPVLWKPRLLMRRTIQAAASTGIHPPRPLAVDLSKTPAELVNATQNWLISLFSKELKVEPSKLDIDTPFQEYGLDSILLAQVIIRMDRELENAAIEPSALLEHPTMESLASYLIQAYPHALASLFSIQVAEKENAGQTIDDQQKILPVPREKESKRLPADNPYPHKKKIAVVGMACHFPDAPDIIRYWENLKTGLDSIREIPPGRWRIRDYYYPGQYKKGKSISKWGAFLDQIEYFDPLYFNIPESLAPQIDPLERQWLEASVEALADAGYDKKALWGRKVGVFAGSRVSNFREKLTNLDKDVIVGVGQNFITAHLAHIYNFKGPNMVVDAACASSLTSIHLAVRSIEQGESEIALAGGVDILLDESPYITLSTAQVLSPDGRCKAFAGNANGIGLGEGCGVLVMQALDQAMAEGRKIYGVIDGTAINNDGNTMGVTTPNPAAQYEVIRAALENAAVRVQTVSCVETHGTGTLIGDPIELKGLSKIFNNETDAKQFCGVGSVKSNIGHLLSAAGAASIIKVLLSIIHRQLVPTLHCKEPNPRFNFKDSPLYLVRELQDWQGIQGIHRAGISAFGLGGHNVHIIVSDEGIPGNLLAVTEPREKKIVFNRKLYWPGELKQESSKNNYQDNLIFEELSQTVPGKEENKEEFMEFFQSERILDMEENK